MASPYVINISKGVGSSPILNGSYATTAQVTGYNNASVLPATQTITAGTNTYAFTIAATGTLTLHVSEDGTAGGKAVVGASFARCDSGGTTYGSAVLTNSQGNAVLPYVPFSATDAPKVYYKQVSSDGNHEFSPTLVNTTLTTNTKTVEISNPLPATRTIGLTDANYANLPIETGTITLS